MGYYSNVAVAVKEKDFRKYLKEHLDNKSIVKFITQDCLTYFAHTYSKENVRILYWKDIKWYEDDYDYYFHIQSVRDNLLKNSIHEFMKIGEYYDDYEYENTFEDDTFLFMVRNIDIACDSEEIFNEKQVNPFL